MAADLGVLTGTAEQVVGSALVAPGGQSRCRQSNQQTQRGCGTGSEGCRRRQAEIVRARSVPDRAGNRGDSRSPPDTRTHPTYPGGWQVEAVPLTTSLAGGRQVVPRIWRMRGNGDQDPGRNIRRAARGRTTDIGLADVDKSLSPGVGQVTLGQRGSHGGQG
jgi:hypothetical protein